MEEKLLIMNNEFLDTLEIRPLTLDDDLNKVAELIYMSDNYIYPYLFEEDLSVAKKVIATMIVEDTIYNYKNIKIALSAGQIVAMIVMKSIPITINSDAMINCFVQAGVPVGARFAKVFNDYFKLLEDEPADVYVANLAVDKMYRNLGVGKVFFGSLLSDNLVYHLEVVKANVSAISLYQKLGFDIDYEYAGFTDVPCYRMTRQKK